jgi:hypothetical protein
VEECILTFRKASFDIDMMAMRRLMSVVEMVKGERGQPVGDHILSYLRSRFPDRDEKAFKPRSSTFDSQGEMWLSNSILHVQPTNPNSHVQSDG